MRSIKLSFIKALKLVLVDNIMQANNRSCLLSSLCLPVALFAIAPSYAQEPAPLHAHIKAQANAQAQGQTQGQPQSLSQESSQGPAVAVGSNTLISQISSSEDPKTLGSKTKLDANTKANPNFEELAADPYKETLNYIKSNMAHDEKDLYTKLMLANHKRSATKHNDSEDKNTTVIDASKCPQGKKWRVAVNQSGNFNDFSKVFKGMTIALMEDNLIKTYPPIYNADFDYSAPGEFDKLAQATKGGCIEFVEGSFHNYNWDRKGVYEDKLTYKQQIANGQINMIWTFGTITGLYYADSTLGIPVLVIDATSPEGAGIIGPGDYSDKPNIHVQKDRTRYMAEVVLFHNLLKFKRMGILIDNTEDNQSGQDIFEIRSLAKNMGFELVPCYGDIMGRNLKQADADFKRCLKELSQEKLDALFLTLVYRPKEPLFPLIKPFIDRGIPIYSQYGDEDVRAGALLSLSESDMIHASLFEANVVKQIVIDGKKPEEISQIFHAPLSISFNMHTARLIEWQPSFEALIAIDNVYSTIENANTCEGYNNLMLEKSEQEQASQAQPAQEQAQQAPAKSQGQGQGQGQPLN